tara:strand:+ start:40 stop:369 length:330 start_codon:yes stop_codon:yes gene_type:complete
MIKILQEITEWEGNVSNGIYHINDSGQLVAYQSPQGELKTFKTPMKQFSKSRRKFKTIDQYYDNSEATLASNVILVKGSKGNTYKIIDGQCSCPGFVYRNTCKHVKELV